MRWEDERWVKSYTRDTATWLLWPWQARALMKLLERKVDSAGLLHVGRQPARSLSVVVGLPEEHVRVGLDALLLSEDGGRATAELHGNVLVLTAFVEAQAAVTTPAEKKRRERERDRDRVWAKAAELADVVSPDVTASHPVSPEVTARHHPDQSSSEEPRGDLSVAPRQVALLMPVPAMPEFDLEAAYRGYPRLEGKTPGLKLLKKQIRTPADYAALLAAIANYRALCEREKREPDKVKLFSTFCGCWRDYIEVQSRAPRPDGNSAAREAGRRMQADIVARENAARGKGEP